MRADNRLNKSLEEAFINNDTQYNFGGWAPQILYPTPPLWVAGNQFTNSLAYSRDGINWSASTNGNSALGRADGIVWGGGKWVAVGSGFNGVAYSYDGINWEKGILNSGTTPNALNWSVAYNGEMWVAASWKTASGLSSPGSIMYSYDGISWDAVYSNATDGRFFGVAWNGSYWLACGIVVGKNLIKSFDGINWTIVSGVGGFLNSVAWNGSMWIIAGGGGNIRYSYDGSTWTSATSATTGAIYGLGWNGSYWLAIALLGGGSFNSISYSVDGINWSGTTNGNSILTQGGLGIAWNGSMWVAAGGNSNNELAYSYDGLVWSGISISSTISTTTLGIASKPAPNLYPPRY